MNQNQLFEDFFQESSSYYLEKLKRYEAGHTLTFNFAAFFLGIFWFLYRKMYMETVLILLFFYLENCFENYFLTEKIGTEQTKLTSYIITIALLIILGFLGNRLYLNKAKRTIDKAKEKFPEYEQQKKYLSKKGGTTFLYVGIVLIIMIAATVMR